MELKSRWLNRIDNLNTYWIFFLGLAIYTSVGVLNRGFIASDEYWHSMIRYLPAQSSSLAGLMDLNDVRSALQNYPMYAIAKLLFYVGVSHPAGQYGGVIICLAVIHFLLMFWAGSVAWDQPRLRKILLILIPLYGIAPFTMTRPMFESLAAPWVFLAAAYGMRYDRNENYWDLVWASLFISVAFAFRPQIGACALVLPLLALFKRRLWDVSVCALVGLLMFIGLGYLDAIWRGEFHGSLRAILNYNLENGALYGRQPWYFYFPLLFGMFMAPFLIGRFNILRLSRQLWQARSALLMLSFFVLAHLCFANKFERFLISIIPLVMIGISALLSEMLSLDYFPGKRLAGFAVLNVMLLVLSGYQVPQANIMSLTRYIDDHPGIKKVFSYSESLSLLPSVLIQRGPLDVEQVSDWKEKNLNCESIIVVNQFQLPQVMDQLKGLDLLAEFPVNWIDDLSFQLNQEHNKRRNKLYAFGCHQAAAT